MNSSTKLRSPPLASLMILDDPDAIRAADYYGALADLFAYPEQADRVIASDCAASVEAVDGAVDNVVLVGMGASRIAAQTVATVAYPFAKIPVVVALDGRLPGYVGARTLVVLVSYAGQTQDCIEAYGDACRRGARVVMVTSGGELESLADGTPLVRLPGGLRSDFALPSQILGCLLLFERLGIAPSQTGAIAEAVMLMRRQRACFTIETPAGDNYAKLLANALTGKLPVLYASSPRLAPVVDHWKARVNSAAKRLSHAGSFPEMTHNELLGWRNALSQSGTWAVVAVRDRGDSVEECTRMDAALDAIPMDVPIHEVFVDGDTLLARLWTGLYFAEVATCYLAVASGELPTAI